MCRHALILAGLAAIPALAGAAGSAPAGEMTSQNTPRLKRALARYPQADANGDGILTASEAMAYLQKLQGDRVGMKPPSDSPASVRAPATASEGYDSWRQVLAGPVPGDTEGSSASGPAGRADWPVVVAGADLLNLKGARPDHLVAFSYTDKWQQVPVQVDERTIVDYHDVYNRAFFGGKCFENLVHADANTCTGADADPTIDADDEVVFMARDAGGRPGRWREPTGVVAGSAVEVEITDPLNGRQAYVYLFRSAGGLDPSAGKCYVRYLFKLRAGEYRANYRFRRGPNPEDSTVTTAFYTRHFSDRWISDGLAIRPPLGSGVDLLDMHKSLFTPGLPARSVLTFSRGEGAFIVNKSGPVRAIRAYVGCNSGPLTEGRHFFYERCEEFQAFLRVHPIRSLVTFTDYSEAARGMRYFNNLNPQGVTVDGAADDVKTGTVTWEMVTGKPGTLITLNRLVSSFADRSPTSYYLDAEKPEVPQVSGDSHAYASSGPWYQRPIGNTDPRKAGWGTFTTQRILLFAGPGATADTARRYLTEAARPLTTRLSAAGR